MAIASLSVHERCLIRKESECQLQIIATMNEFDHCMIIQEFFMYLKSGLE